jgi:hypothetical protein
VLVIDHATDKGDYIRGVFELEASVRSGLQQSNGYLLTIRQVAHTVYAEMFCDSGCVFQPRSFPSRTYVRAIVWGQDPRFRVIIVISPLAIMIATVVIILASLYRARHLDLYQGIASFSAMDPLHLIAACSSGNVHTLSFPDYSQDIGLFSKNVRVELTEMEARSGVAGFSFISSR